MRTALLGFTLDDDRVRRIVAEDREMPSQTHRFAWSLVRTLEAANEPPFLLSAAPVSNYPGHPRVVFCGGPFLANGRQGRELSFLNIVGLKHVTRFVAAMTSGRKALRSQGVDTLIVHGVHSPWLWFAAAMRRSGMSTIVVITDPPGVVGPEDSPLVASLKAIDSRVVRASLRHQSAVVVLAPALAAEWAPTLPHMLMEGIAPQPVEGTTPGSGPTEGPFRILYAGGLSEVYGVRALVEAVRLLPVPGVELRTIGKGPLWEWINMQSHADARILPPDLVAPSAVPAELDRANLLVQPRPIAMREARYSFPSKVLEYLAAGRPVVTTPLPSLPPEYRGVTKVSEGDSADALRDAILAVMEMPEADRRGMGLASRSFAVNRKSAGAQARRLAAFLAEVRPPTEPPDRAKAEPADDGRSTN